MIKLLLYGGTFNPIHIGHLIVAKSVQEAYGFNKVIFVPNGVPPHKKGVVASEHRLEMLKLAIKGDPFFEINTYEIEKETPSYTIETVRHIREFYGGKIDLPYWLIGPDNASQIPHWYKSEKLIKECKFLIGCNYQSEKMNINHSLEDEIMYRNVHVPHIDIRSTYIRGKIRNGQSIKHMVPEAVEKYIKENHLYE